MSRTRAADDFPAIHARMQELRWEDLTRPRAADDFATIRARIDELRRERTRASAAACSTVQNAELRRSSPPICWRARKAAIGTASLSEIEPVSPRRRGESREGQGTFRPVSQDRPPQLHAAALGRERRQLRLRVNYSDQTDMIE
jgi:hypothetical protein